MTRKDVAALASRIRQVREERHISLNKLAEATSVSKGYLSQLERGEASNPSVEVVRKIAQELGVSLSWLVGEEEPDPPSLHALPAGLQEYVAREAKRGNPVPRDVQEILARMHRRGRPAKSVDDWAFLHAFIKRHL